MLRRAMMAALSGDPHWANVVSLLHFDGANNSTLFVDETGNQWVAGNQAKISTAQSKFGGSAAYFDGSSDYIDCSPSNTSRLAFGTGDFAIEAWIYVASLSTRFVILDSRTSGLNSGVMFLVGTAADGAAYNGALILEMRSTSPSYTGEIATSGGVIPLNTWTHVAVTREGNFYRFFVNGVLQTGSGASGSGSGWNYPNGRYRIGYVNDNNAAYSANGYIDELRVTKGAARYTENFTPPTAPFPTPPPPLPDPHWANVVSLLHFDGADGSTTFTDEKGKTWTSVGGQLQSNQLLTHPATAKRGVRTTSPSSDFQLGSDFTVEAFVTFSGAANSPHIILIHNGTFANRCNLWWVGGTLSWHRETNGSPIAVINAAWTPTLGTKYHVAVTRTGGTTRLFVAGALLGSAADAAAYPATSYCTIGSVMPMGSGAGDVFDGLTDDVRITNGVARYTANFTPPTAPFPNQ